MPSLLLPVLSSVHTNRSDRWSTASPPLSPLIYPASDKFYNLSFLMCPRNVCCLILIHSINVLFVAVLSYAITVRIDISVSHFHLLLMKDSRVIFSFLLYDLKFFLLQDWMASLLFNRMIVAEKTRDLCLSYSHLV